MIKSVKGLALFSFAFIVLQGCGADTKDFIKKDEAAALVKNSATQLETKLSTLEVQLGGKIEQRVLQLQQDMSGVKGDLATVTQLKIEVADALKQVKGLVDELKSFQEKLDQKGVKMRQDLIITLQAQEKILQDQINNIRILLEALKKEGS